MKTLLPETGTEGSIEQNSSTQFVNDATVKSVVIPSNLPDSFNFESEIQVGQDIQNFLSKPTILRSGEFSISDPISGTPNIYSPADVFADTVYRSKLDGYFGFRGTLCLRLQANATKFQQGRYMLAYIPTGGARISGTANALAGDTWLSSHITFLTTRTQLPHVELDLACDTEVSMRIPYSSSLDFFPLASLGDLNRLGNLGVIKIFPYSRLVAASGLTTASYTLWAHWEDVELVGQAVPQMAKGVTSRRGKSASEHEQVSAGVGPISSVAFNISKAAAFLNPVPVLGNYSSSLSWVADIVGNMASVFGWSKPSSVAPANRMLLSSSMYASNVDAVDNSLPLALSVKNAVQVDPMISFGEIDELDISNFVSRPAFFRQFEWDNTQPFSTLLSSWAVSPATDVLTHNNLGITSEVFTPCQYIANNFANWRGSMVYTFKIVKTGFHSGRIMVAFSPEELKTVVTPLTFGNTDYLLRQVIDVREHSEFTIVVPYISSSPYQPTQGFDLQTGSLYIYVVDELVAPDTVSPSVTILVEQSMGADAEFFFPVFRPKMFNTAYVDAQMAKEVEIAKPQMAGEEETGCVMPTAVIGGAPMPKFQLQTSQTTVGERLLNLRTLLKKFFPIGVQGVVTSTPSGAYENILPFAHTARTPLVIGNENDTINDLYGIMSSFYMYSRGGTRLKFISTGNQTNGLIAMMEPLRIADDSINSIVVASSNTNNNSDFLPSTQENLPYVHANSLQDQSVEVSVPMYSTYRNRNNADHLASREVPYRVQTGSLATLTSCFITSVLVDKEEAKPTLKGYFLRAGADDVDFGGFVSIPPLSS